MDCPRFRVRMHALVEGDLDAATARPLLSHAALCAACAGALDSSRRLLAALRREGGVEVAPPAHLLPRLLGSLSPVPRAASSRRRAWLLPVAAGVAPSSAALAAWALLSTGGGRQGELLWLRIGLRAVSEFATRFATLLAAADRPPLGPASLHAPAASGPQLAAAALIATGLLGATLAACLASGGTRRGSPRPLR